MSEFFLHPQNRTKNEIRANIPDTKIADNLATIIVISLISKNDNHPIELGVMAKKNNGRPINAHRMPSNP
jgi:hypothetical protein